MRQADCQQKGKVEDMLIWGYSTECSKNDWGFNPSLLSPGDFNSKLRGCYKEGIMRI